MILLTQQYAQRPFFIPYSIDQKEGVYVTPLTLSRRNEIKEVAQKNAGYDNTIAETYILQDMLKASIKRWEGFYDVAHDPITYSAEALSTLVEYDPDFFTGLLVRVLNVARHGVLSDEKNL